MKALWSLLVILAASIATLVGAIAIWIYSASDHASLRYRLTYVVDVNGETRKGSGIIEIRSSDTSKLPVPGRGFGFSAKGEAVVVDLGGGRYLFSLLNNAATLPFEPFIDFFEENGTAVDVTRALKAEKPSIDLTSNRLPRLVAFTDINDPSSVRNVSPDDLAMVFGPGVRLKSSTLEITDAPITTGHVERLLGWWLDQARGRYDPPAFKVPNKSPRGYSTVGVTEFFQNIDWRQR